MAEPSWSRVATQFFTLTPKAASPVQGPVQADGKALGYCNGFICDTAGTVTVQGRNGNNTVTLPVLAGVRYDFSISFLLSTSPAMNVVGFI